MANHATYQAYLDKLTALAYTLPSADQQYWQNKLIEDLDTAGVLARLDVFYLFLQDSSAASVGINIIDPDNYEITAVNSPTWTSDVGYQGTGGTQYLDTNWTPSTDAVNFAAADAGIYMGVGSDFSGGNIDTGNINNSSGRVFLRSRTASDQYEGQVNGSSTPIGGGTVTSSIARTLWDRLSNDITIYRNGSSDYNVTNAAGGIPTTSVFIMAAQTGTGSALGNSPRLYKYFLYGASLRDLITDLDAAFVDYETDYQSAAPAGDTTAPSVPTGLTEVDKTDTTVQISWTASTDDTAVTGYRVYIDGVEEDTTASTGYTFTGLTQSTEYDFTVSAYDDAANESAQSTALTITTEATPVAPSFSTHPASQMVNEDTEVTFTIVASGVPTPTYQWQVDTGGGFANISGETSTSYVFTCDVGDTGNQYRCVATNSEGTTNSNAAILTVNDTTAPSGPTSLTEDAVSDTTIDISWTASTDNVAVSGYEIFVDDVSTATTASTSYQLTTLTPETTYAIKVRAYDEAGNNSAYSNTVNSTTEAAPAAPAFSTHPATQSVDDGSNASFTVAATGNPAPTYQWQVNTGASWANVSGETSTTYTFAVSLSDSGNQYRCVATNTEGSATSNVAVLTVNDIIAPSVPAGLTLINKDDTSVEFSWSASTDDTAVTGYRVFVDGLEDGTTASTSYTATGLSASTEYDFTVAAYDAATNESAQSAALTVTTEAAPDVTAPTVPANLALVSKGENNISISWDASTDAVGVTGYRVYLDGVQVDTTASTTYNFTGLTAGTTYSLTVAAYDAAGNVSAQSTSLDVATDTAVVVGESTTTSARGYIGKVVYNLLKDAYAYRLQKRVADAAIADSTATSEALDCVKAQVYSLSKISLSGTDGALQQFINSDANSAKISPSVNRQMKAAPRLVYQVITNLPSDTKDGVSKLDQITVQVSCHAPEYEQCEEILQEVRELIDRYTGTVAGIGVQSVQYVGENDLYSESADLFGKSHDYKIRFPR